MSRRQCRRCARPGDQRKLDRQGFTSTILGETHSFAHNDYWAEWVSNRFGGGLCSDRLSAGDELLMLVDTSDSSFNPTVFPLVLTGVPDRPAPGQPFTVGVTEYRTSGAPGTSTPAPADGVTISGGGASAVTGADGRATLTLPQSGPAALRAVRGGARSTVAQTCATDGADGACGTATPPACATTGDDGLCGTRDRRAPRAKITSVRERQRFARGRGPRTLAGIVTPDPSGIARVRLRLTRTAAHRRCSTFDARSERFAALKRCGAARGRWFDAGTREKWSYLLPVRLPAGRYVLDVRASDRAGNADTLLQRTRTRVVFTVA